MSFDHFETSGTPEPDDWADTSSLSEGGYEGSDADEADAITADFLYEDDEQLPEPLDDTDENIKTDNTGTEQTMHQEALPQATPNFHDLNPGQPHRIARTEVNAKLIKMAQTELGLPTVTRAPVPDEYTDWHVDYPEYQPIHIDLPRGSTPYRKEGDVSDPADPSQIASFKSLEVAVVERDEEGRPLNPMGRTGISGRGILDKWGPTEAADLALTRNNPETGELEALLIERDDAGRKDTDKEQAIAWAFPGGKVDTGEDAHQAATREIVEEAGVRGILLDFSAAEVVSAGYIDESRNTDNRRNTDNSWMESTVLHHHLNEEEARSVIIQAGSDAKTASWRRVNEDLYAHMFGSHGQQLRLAVER